MEITFSEVELVKKLLEQTVAGANKIKQIGAADFQAVIDFIGSDSKEDAETTMELLLMQRDEAQLLLNRINEEFGFDTFEPDNGGDVFKGEEIDTLQISVLGVCRDQFEKLCKGRGVELVLLAVLNGYIVFTYPKDKKETILFELKLTYELYIESIGIKKRK